MRIFDGQVIPLHLDNCVTEILAKVTAFFCIKKKSDSAYVTECNRKNGLQSSRPFS